MMASPNLELSLDNIAPYLQLEEYLSCLEDERLKIDVVKCELPLCMNLLSKVVEASRQQLQSYKATTTNQGTIQRPILEESIPIKHSNLESPPPDQQKSPPATSDKASWMASAQLWSPTDEEPTTKRSKPVSTKLSPLDNNNNKSLKNRKRRRLWTPDLHRRFLDALQMLGGFWATPRQIRELMNVDGLTQGEVKSHLQKYRQDTKRAGPNPQQGPGATGPQSVVLGGMWVPPEYASAAHRLGVQGPTIIYDDAQPTAQMDPRYYPQEFYSPPPQWHGSLKSHGGRPERDRSESVEDGKCESSHNRMSNGRKKLASKAQVS